MVRAYSAARAAGGRLLRAAVGFVGFLVVVGAIAPRPDSDAGARSQAGDPAGPESTVVLSVPEGKLGGHLTIVDGAGRELVTLTHWFNGSTSIIAGRGGEAVLSCFFDGKGAAALKFNSTAGGTCIEARSDGTTRILEKPLESRQHSDNP